MNRPGSGLPIEQEVQANMAHQRARESSYVMCRVSPNRFNIFFLDGVSARGISGSTQMYGVKLGRQVFKKDLTWEDANDVMRRIDLEGYEPEGEV